MIAERTATSRRPPAVAGRRAHRIFAASSPGAAIDSVHDHLPVAPWRAL